MITSSNSDRLKFIYAAKLLIQARGLDVMPTTISRFRNGGDHKTADLLETVIYPEEITHCAAGVRWFKYLCARSTTVGPNNETGLQKGEDEEEVINKFHATVRKYFRGPLKPPFNVEARKSAGFAPKWYEPLASLLPTELKGSS